MALTLMRLYNFQSLAYYKNRKYVVDVFALLNQITNNHSLPLDFQVSIIAIGKKHDYNFLLNWMVLILQICVRLLVVL